MAQAGLKPDIFPKMMPNTWFSCFYLASAGLQVVSPTSRYAVLGVLDRSSANWATSLDPTWISERSFFNCILFILCACLCVKLLNYIYLVYAFIVCVRTCMWVCVCVCRHTYALASVWRSESQHVEVISLLTLCSMLVPKIKLKSGHRLWLQVLLPDELSLQPLEWRFLGKWQCI